MRPFHALPFVACAAIGVVAFGPWGAVGVVAGLAAGLAAHQLGLRGFRVAAVASTPPLVATGPLILPVAVVLLLLVTSERFRDPRIFLLSALGVLLPIPGGVFVPALGGALLLATAPMPLALIGVVLVGLVWVPGMDVSPPLAALAIIGALLARAMARHPANLSRARTFLAIGLSLAAVPPLAGFAIAAAGMVPAGGGAVFKATALGILLGVALLLVHLGLAVMHLAEGVRPEAWTTLAWGTAAVSAAALIVQGLDSALGQLPLLSLVALPMLLGFVWSTKRREQAFLERDVSIATSQRLM